MSFFNNSNVDKLNYNEIIYSPLYHNRIIEIYSNEQSFLSFITYLNANSISIAILKMRWHFHINLNNDYYLKSNKYLHNIINDLFINDLVYKLDVTFDNKFIKYKKLISKLKEIIPNVNLSKVHFHEFIE